MKCNLHSPLKFALQDPLSKITFNDRGRLIIICYEQLVNRSFYLHRPSTDVCSDINKRQQYAWKGINMHNLG
ncbi:CLUMA_CG020808, isoform A [Clunio marinus]|uniref:CLUMA_CG020808, isoform A n=1 Tax=Clunio marinus TaxID=568069 RepID=A0A1J1J8R0_9DIPT|nr:CLUMA_CG020808, isoform A [Clunio marinus]